MIHTHTQKTPQINTKHLHLSRNPCLLPSFPLRCVWCTSQSEAYEYMLFFLFFFPPFPICVCVAMRLYSYHHYPSQYPHVHVLIMLSMSSEVSQAAESLVDLFGVLLRPHSEISVSSAKDHPPGKIIGSYWRH